MHSGTVKWFNATKGYGFITPDEGGPDAFVHITAVKQAGLDGLDEGQRVEYELETGRNGKQAAEQLKVIG
ncbi:MAG: cold-shock protein [Alphaproteobacteria bacterium]|nr:cold-shock protein [Alphaproteobacteria bacterium]